MGLFDNLFKKKTINEKEIDVNVEAIKFSRKGLENYQQQKYDAAIDNFAKAISIQPSNQNFYTLRGTSYENMGNDVLAEKDFSMTLKITPDDYVAAFRLGMINFRRKDLESAVKYLKISYDNAPDGDLAHTEFGDNNLLFIHKKIITGNLGNFLTLLKRFEEGFRYLEEAIEIAPEYPNPYLAKGMALSQMGKHKDGLPFLKMAEKLGHPQAQKGIKLLEKLAIERESSENEELNLDFVFYSSNHLRYENGVLVPGNGSFPRAIKVEGNVNGNEGYTVTIFSIDDGQAVIQMAPKQMELVSVDNARIQLRGFGYDSMGASFADYGLSIIHDNGTIKKCLLHMHDRDVDIEYFE